MKVLLVSPELDPLTGSSPLGIAVRRTSRELHASPDTDVVLALPASDAILKNNRNALTQTNAAIAASSSVTHPPTARVSQLNASNGAQTFFIHSPKLCECLSPDRHPAELADNMIHWAGFVANLLVCLKPRVHVVHLFGWENALIPPLLRSLNLPFKTILTTSPERGAGPPFASIIDAAHRSSFTEFNFLQEKTDSRPLITWAASFADISNHLSEIAPTDRDIRDIMSDPALAMRAKQSSRTTTLVIHGLVEDPRAPLIYIPTADPAPLLGILDRILDANARVILQGDPRDAATEAALLATQMRHPGKLAFFKSKQFEDDEQDWLTGVDFFLLLPADADDPENASRIAFALTRGCTPIIPRRRHLSFPQGENPGGPHDEIAVSYRKEDPDGIWNALKRSLALHEDPFRWRDQVQDAVRTGLAEEGVTPAVASLYREVVESSLAASA